MDRCVESFPSSSSSRWRTRAQGRVPRRRVHPTWLTLTPSAAVEGLRRVQWGQVFQSCPGMESVKCGIGDTTRVLKPDHRFHYVHDCDDREGWVADPMTGGSGWCCEIRGGRCGEQAPL